MRISIVLFILFIPYTGVSQYGYYGKRVSLEFGLIPNQYLLNKEVENYNIENYWMIPQLEFGINRQNRSGVVVGFVGKYQQLPNAMLAQATTSNNNYYIINSRIDTIKTKSDNYSAGIKFRFYRNMSPSGMYMEWSIKTNFISNHSSYTSIARVDSIDYNIYHATTSIQEIKELNVIPSFSFGVGKSFLVSKSALINFGGSIEIPFGKYKDKSSKTGLLPVSTCHKILDSRRLLTSNLFQLYVKIELYP